MVYLFAALFASATLYFVFRLPNIDGMLYSSYAIDLIMAADFIIEVKKTSRYGRIPIAICKLLGDFFAWLAYLQYSRFVLLVGAFVLVLNLYYFACCLELKSKERGV